MRKLVIYSIVLLAVLYLYIQWKKKVEARKTTDPKTTNTNVLSQVPQKNDNTLSNVENIRGDAVTGQSLIDANSSSVNSSATSNNPIVRENNQPVTINEIGVVSVDAVPKIPMPPIFTNTEGFSGGTAMKPPTPISDELQSSGLIPPNLDNSGGLMISDSNSGTLVATGANSTQPPSGATLIQTLASGQQVYQDVNGNTYTIWPS